MKKETYKKAKELLRDIENLTVCIEEKEKGNWIKVVPRKREIKVISPANNKVDDIFYSIGFQRDLLSFLKLKRDEYQKEFDELI